MVLAAYMGAWELYFALAFVGAMLVYALFRVICDGVRRLFGHPKDDADSE